MTNAEFARAWAAYCAREDSFRRRLFAVVRMPEPDPAEFFDGKRTRIIAAREMPVPPPYDGSMRRPRYWKKVRER